MAKLHVSEPNRTSKIEGSIQEKVTTMNLENQLLIAMPSLNDSFFKKTVTYICEHNEEGAMGLIINLPIEITLCDLLKKIEPDINDSEKVNEKGGNSHGFDQHVKNTNKTIGDSNRATDVTHSLEQLVLSGGPIAKDRGFVLHRAQHGWSSSLALSKELMITTSKIS
jgi:putative transcriptional regulator